MTNFLTDANDIDTIILTENGQKKVQEKIIHYLDTVFKKDYPQASDPTDIKNDLLNNRAFPLNQWYRISNGYNFHYHDKLPGIIATHDGESHNSIFKHDRGTYIPWEDIADIKLSY